MKYHVSTGKLVFDAEAQTRYRALDIMLRHARQQIFERESRQSAITWIKRNMAKYREAELGQMEDKTAMSASYGW